LLDPDSYHLGGGRRHCWAAPWPCDDGGGDPCDSREAALVEPAATRGRRRRPEGGNAGGAGGDVGHPARNRGEAVEGGGAPGEVRVAALWEGAAALWGG